MKIQMIIEVEHPEDLMRVLQSMVKHGMNPTVMATATGTLVYPDVGNATPASAPVEAKPADPKPDGKKAGGGARKPPKDETPAVSGGPAPSPTTPSPTQSAPEQSGGASTQPEGAVATPIAVPAAKKDPVSAAAGAAAAVSGLPDAVRNTTSMRDLLTYLAEHGVDSMDAMVAACVTLQKDVPILAKVPKVDERVRRACEVLQLFPEKAAEETAA